MASGAEQKASVVALTGKDMPFEVRTVAVGDLSDAEVEIAPTMHTLCATDVTMLGDMPFLEIPGHECVGRVTKVGKDVKNIKIGQRVGAGWFYNTCGDCPHCQAGREQHCPMALPFLGGVGGTFKDVVRVNYKWAFPIPDSLDDATASSLMCAGITVFSPLSRRAKAGQTVGVVGVGGLGHLAIQFAKAMGCKVVAFSTSADKAELCKNLGADVFVHSTEAKEMSGVRDSVDLILNTVSTTIDLLPYFNVLTVGGTLVQLSAGTDPVKLDMWECLCASEKNFAGSFYGGRQTMADMLHFAAKHKIKAMCDEVVCDAQGVGKAFDLVKTGKARCKVALSRKTS